MFFGTPCINKARDVWVEHFSRELEYIFLKTMLSFLVYFLSCYCTGNECKYRVTHKEWDFRDDYTESIKPCIFVWRYYLKQKLLSNIQIFIFSIVLLQDMRMSIWKKKTIKNNNFSVIHTWSDKGFKRTVVNRKCHSINGRTLEITYTVMVYDLCMVYVQGV